MNEKEQMEQNDLNEPKEQTDLKETIDVEEPTDLKEPKELKKRSKEKKKIKLGRKIFFLLVLVILSGLMTFCFSMGSELCRKDTRGGKPVDITVNQGDTATQIAHNLKKNGVIRYTTPFLVRLYFSDYKGKIQYGTFRVNRGMSLDTLIKTLSNEGAQKGYTAFTIPEGDSIVRIAERLESKGIMPADDFIAAVKKQAGHFVFKDQLPSEEKVFYQLEGYIYPDTYYVTDSTTGDELVEMILEDFEEHFDESRQTRAKKMGLTMQEVIIRASMVQKETELAKEYPVVAGVIQNRLDRDMNLQFDSTIVYAVTKGRYGKERVLHSDLKVDSAYNTYTHKGLPAGPICSPGIEAIDGVLNPDKHDYLFFQYDAVKDDGSNLYFETYEEHEAAMATTGTDGEAATAATGTEGEAATGTKEH